MNPINDYMNRRHLRNVLADVFPGQWVIPPVRYSRGFEIQDAQGRMIALGSPDYLIDFAARQA